MNKWIDWTTKTTASIRVGYDKGRNGMSIRCVITDEAENTIVSDEAVLTYDNN